MWERVRLLSSLPRKVVEAVDTQIPFHRNREIERFGKKQQGS
jgi:hypothetical protein